MRGCRMSQPILTLERLVKRFDPRLTLGDRIAAAIGAGNGAQPFSPVLRGLPALGAFRRVVITNGALLWRPDVRADLADVLPLN